MKNYNLFNYKNIKRIDFQINYISEEDKNNIMNLYNNLEELN